MLRMTHEQYDRLRKLSYSSGDHQEMLKRIRADQEQEQEQEQDDYVHALVLATDMSRIREALKKQEEGYGRAYSVRVLNQSVQKTPNDFQWPRTGLPIPIKRP